VTTHPSAGRGFPDLRTLGRTWESPAGAHDVVATNDDGRPRYVITRADGGHSEGEFARGNLADHVGDDAQSVFVNRGQLATTLGASRGLAFIGAVHGGAVAWVDSPGTYPGVDALITDKPGLGLVALGADCAVIGLHSHRVDSPPLAAVAHCGWKGLVADVIGAVVESMREAGGVGIQAVVGPAICGRCYQVDADRCRKVRSAVSPRVGSAAVCPGMTSADEGSCGIDIRAGARERLMELGVQVDDHPLLSGIECTFESELWFSFRRASVAGGTGRTGRQALAVVAGGTPSDHGVVDSDVTA
jgi:YfiH family protein